MKFEDLEFKAMDKEIFGKSYKTKDGMVALPCQAYTTLSNGIEVSVVRHGGSYGHEKGLYEMGAYHEGGDNMMHIEAWDDQVKGWLSDAGVEKELEYLEKI